MHDSDIVSTLKVNDIPKFIKIKNNMENWENLNEEIIENEESDNYIDIEKYGNFLNEINNNFLQEEINQLKNESDVIFYFYIKELFCLDFINTNYKDNKNERMLYKRFSNTLLRLLFENNKAIKEISQNINQKIIDINKKYDNFDLNMDLSEKTYLNRIKNVFKTEELPHFLLVRGYRILKSLTKEKENYENYLKKTNFDDSIKIDKSDTTDDVQNDNNFLNIINKLYTKELTPFYENYDISLNQDLLYLFLMFYLEYKKEDIKNLQKKVINQLISFFLLDSYEGNSYQNIIKNINYQDKGEIINKIIDSFFNEQYCNSKEYSIKFIMASYCYIIFEIGFDNPIKLFQAFIYSLDKDLQFLCDIKIYLREFQDKIKNNDDYNTYFKKTPITQTTNQITNPKEFNVDYDEIENKKNESNITNPKQLLKFEFEETENKKNESNITYTKEFEETENKKNESNITNPKEFEETENKKNESSITNPKEFKEKENKKNESNITNPKEFKETENKKNESNITNPKQLLNFEFDDIENKMNECCEKSLKEVFQKNILEEKKLEKKQDEERSKRRFGLIMNWLNNKFNMDNQKNEFIQKKLKLIPHSNIVKGNMVTIFIQGFYSSDYDVKEYWINFTNEYLKEYPNSMIYYYYWPSTNLEFKDILYHKQEFNFADERGKICGKILANIIESNLFFGNFNINLVGFSLGGHIVKNCLLELLKRKVYNKINNVIFIAGATSYINENWDEIFKVIKGKIFNCYSKFDVGLIVRSIFLYDYSIGRNRLKEDDSRIININCTPCIHLLYRIKLNKIAEIFMNYFFKN